MKRRSYWSAALVLVGLPAIVILGLVFGLTGGVASPQRIKSDVIVGPVRLQGANRSEAAALLAGLKPEDAGWGLRFTCGLHTWQPAAAELGVSVDVDGTLSDAWRAGQANALGHIIDRITGRRRSVVVPLRLKLDEATLRDRLGRMAAEVNVPPRNASFDLRTGRVMAEASGQQVDLEAVVARVRAAAQTTAPGTIELALLTVSPATRAVDLVAVGTGELARFETYYRADVVDRSTNIELAVARLNGTIVKPGEVFSFNATVGPRTRELGYREALEIVNGEYVPGLGGGVCQVSSTVYNACLLAGLNVVERYPHSRKPLYVDPGRDATVVYGSLDLKLRNDRKTAVLVAAYADNGVLCIALRGRAETGEYYSIRTSVVETIPAATRQEPDTTLAPGTSVVKEKPVDGLRVLVYRICSLGDRETRQAISNDFYQPVTGVTKVSPGDLTPAPPRESAPDGSPAGVPGDQMPPPANPAGPPAVSMPVDTCLTPAAD